MLNPKWAEFWWTDITGANMVVSKVATALFENKMVVLEVPDDLPWRYQLRTAIELTFRRDVNSESYAIQIIDDADECDSKNPGLFLLERFAKSRSIRMGYRSAARHSLQDYLISNKVLNNSIIWVKGLDTKRAKEWLDFCREYNSLSVENGLFVLEVKGLSNLGDTKSAAKISYSTCVTKYDVQLFNNLILAESEIYSDKWKQYIATLAAELCVTDAEISAELIKCIDLRSKEVIDGFQYLEEAGNYSRRGASKNSNHILSYYRNNSLQEINKRIWSAQLKVLFPIIEMERLKFIGRYNNEILKAVTNENITQYDEVVTCPNDVELGTLHYLVKNYKIDMPVASDRDRIVFLRECRNKIAHMNCCSIDEVRQLING